MIFTHEHELTIRRALAEKVAALGDAGFVIPSPIYFVDAADFWASINGLAINTKRLIDTTNIAFCVISLRRRVDSEKEGCNGNPLIRLTYNFHFFRGYTSERADESLTPDSFLKRTLKTYNTFIKAVLETWTEFLGYQNIPALPEGVEGFTNSLTEPDFIEDKAPCRYIPGVVGHSVDLQTVVEVLIQNED